MVKLLELERNSMGKVSPIKFVYNKENYDKPLPIKINDYDIRYGKDHWATYNVTAWDGDKLVMVLAMNPIAFYSIKGYAIDSANVEPDYQGKGLGYQLYKKLVTELDLVLISKDSHSVGARKTWVKLSQDPNLSIYGFNLVKSYIFKVKPNKDKTELTGKLEDLYDKDGTGVIMVRKNSYNDKRLTNMLKVRPLG